MDSISERITVESRLSWALLWMGVVVFLFALIWGMLNPHVHSMRDTGGQLVNSTAGPSDAAQTGWSRVMIVWELAPLCVALGILYYGLNRALSESRRTPR